MRGADAPLRLAARLRRHAHAHALAFVACRSDAFVGRPRFRRAAGQCPTPFVRMSVCAGEGGSGVDERRTVSGPEAEKRFSADALSGGVLQRLGDQAAGIVDPVKRDEAAHARSLRRSEQCLVERLEPPTQRVERVPLADLEYHVLNDFSVRVGGQPSQLIVEIAQRVGFYRVRCASLEFRHDKVAGVIDGQADQLVELGVASR